MTQKLFPILYKKKEGHENKPNYYRHSMQYTDGFWMNGRRRYKIFKRTADISFKLKKNKFHKNNTKNFTNEHQ